MKLTIKMLFLVFGITTNLFAQKNVVDQIIAVVGNQIVLLSEVEKQLQQYNMQGITITEKLRCEVMEDFLLQKLLVYQAGIDSVEVADEQVEAEMDRRIRFFLSQFETVDAMEEFLGKSISDMKKEFRSSIRDQLLMQAMQQKIIGNVSVTPSEVKAFYKSIPKDSLPLIPAEYEVGQIVLIPKIDQKDKDAVRAELNKIREDIIAGSKFTLKARLYSEDRGSAEKGGELGFLGREDLVPEFSAAAFRLKPGEISEIVETEFGYHIIQLIERRGELANFRHILLKAKPSEEQVNKAEKRIDSIYNAILTVDTLTFEKAAKLYSDDEETKFNGGLMINMYTGTTKFEADQLDVLTFRTISRLKPGTFSAPSYVENAKGQKVFRILYLKTKTEPHVANLTDDYQKIKVVAEENKKNEVMNKWISKKIPTIFIKIDSRYSNCEFENNWLKAN